MQLCTAKCTAICSKTSVCEGGLCVLWRFTVKRGQALQEHRKTNGVREGESSGYTIVLKVYKGLKNARGMCHRSVKCGEV